MQSTTASDHYEPPLALQQYCLDWLTVRQVPICFTAGEATEPTEERQREAADRGAMAISGSDSESEAGQQSGLQLDISDWPAARPAVV